MNDVREIAERLQHEVELTEDPECGLAKDITAICAHVLRSPEPLGATYQEIRKARCEWCAKGTRMDRDPGSGAPIHVLRVEGDPAGNTTEYELCTAPAPEQVIEEQGREIERLRKPAAPLGETAEDIIAAHVEAQERSIREKVATVADLRAQLQTAEQQIAYISKLAEDQHNRDVSALQASQQEAVRVRAALEAAKPYVRMIQLHLETEGKEGQSKARQVLALIDAALAPAPSAPQGEQGAADSKVDRTVKDSLTVAEYRCTRCNGLAEWDASQSVWRHMSGDPLSDRLIEQSFCDKYGYPIDVRVAATPAVEHPDTTRLKTVLSAIETHCGDEFCEELDLDAAFRPESLDERTKQLATRISAIYRIAHAFNLSHGCYHAHNSWRAEVDDAARNAGKEQCE